MSQVFVFPKIFPLTNNEGVYSDDSYGKMIVSVVSEILSEFYPEGDTKEFVNQNIPLIGSSKKKELPFNFSFFLLCKKKNHAPKFFNDIITKWLIPGKQLSPVFSIIADFKFEESHETYTVCHIQFLVHRELDYEMMSRNFEILIHEVRMGVTSTYHAHRVLEMRGLCGSEKIGLVQEEISQLIERFPQRFDYDMFEMMQHCFVVSREEFKLIRECRHLVRVISSLYLLRKNLALMVEKDPSRRQILFFCKKAILYLPLGTKQVLSLFVGLNFLRENEVFAKKHLLRAIQNLIPQIHPIEESYLEIQETDYSTHLFYLEIEKNDKEPFSLEEIKLLRKELPDCLKGRVEYLLRPVFMPRNEEEVMRNIIVLSQQLKYVKDLPQVIISFDEQTDRHLTFTVILVRVNNEQTRDYQTLVQQISSIYEVMVERERKVGMIRNKYNKQALVFRFKLPSSPFFREDDSLDLYLARKEVLLELQKAFGEVRDFNGGMISKQSEAFLSLKKLLGSLAVNHKLLLENFFHSIYPIEARSILNPKILKNLFLMMLSQQKNTNKKFSYVYESGEGCQLVLIDFYEVSLKQNLIEKVNQLQIVSRKLIQLHLQTVDAVILGLIHLEFDEDKRANFYSALQEILDF